MSLLMQALRKAERAKDGRVPAETHEDDELALTPLETDVRKVAAGNADPVAGGTVFSLEPIEPATSREEDIPVVAATEAMHNPVPPQARAAAEARLATDGPPPPPIHPVQPDTPSGTDAVRGARRDEGTRSTPASGPWSRTGAATRASASAARQRLGALIGLLTLVLLGFGFLYWRAVSGPGPGASLPPVPMPGPGLAAAPPVAPSGVIPGIEPAQQPATGPAYGSPGSAPGAVSSGAASPTAGTAGGAMTGAAPASAVAPYAAPPAPANASAVPISGNDGAAGPRTAAAATRPQPRVVIPTPEALAAIEDPAIRAEAMRDAEERAARAARDADVPHPGSPPQPHSMPPGVDAATVAAAAIPHDTGGVTVRRTDSAPATLAARRPVTTSAASPAAPLPDNGSDVRIVRHNGTPQVSPTLQNAWSAYQAGDLAAARQQYDQALVQDPNSKDALLGSAAVAIRERNGQQAAANYIRLLELDPNDPEALSGLAALRPGDIMQTETRLKGILQQSPESGPVLFALGNLYARQARWPEAQQAYFRAYSAAPANPDYAFNLAIGLDRLNQGRLARDYYQRALTLAQAAPAGFSHEAVRKRLQELGAAGP